MITGITIARLVFFKTGVGRVVLVGKKAVAAGVGSQLITILCLHDKQALFMCHLTDRSQERTSESVRTLGNILMLSRGLRRLILPTLPVGVSRAANEPPCGPPARNHDILCRCRQHDSRYSSAPLRTSGIFFLSLPAFFLRFLSITLSICLPFSPLNLSTSASFFCSLFFR